jgi:SAM-dependent methyltransferase
MPSPHPSWLASAPSRDGLIELSRPRAYAHDESAYDAAYDSDPENTRVGHGVCDLVRRFQGDVSRPALEIGAGTGLVSLGLVERSPYPIAIISDPSPAFLRIVRRKVERLAPARADSAVYAVLMGEELDPIPDGALSLVVLRSTLHHVLDVDGFLNQVGRVLAPGGLLIMQEPCMEGYVLMGAMIQFLPELARAAGRSLTPQEIAKVAEFRDTMAFYARRDMDKTHAEDKHLFRVDELMCSCARAGMRLEFLPNTMFEHACGDEAEGRERSRFGRFFRDYAHYCMSFPSSLLERFDEHLAPYCAMVESVSGGGSGPYMHGVFVGIKTSSRA